jgi:tRNA G18 (ribose-2'-O)-methylase SpoU
MTKLNAKQLRKSDPKDKEVKKIKRTPIYLVLNRIIDTYNIGSLFRLADAIAVEKMYLCGEMEYPPSSRIHKAAVGTEKWVPWVRHKSAPDAIKKLKSRGVQIIAVEQHKRSTDYRLLTSEMIKFPVAIIAGNETEGLSKKVLDLADIIVELPMFGINKSFNVWGSTAVVTYKVLEFLRSNQLTK